MSGRGTGRAGMTLLELLVSVTIFSAAVTVAYTMLAEAQNYYDGATMHLILNDDARRMTDKIANELITGGMLNPANPSNADWIEFQKVTGVHQDAPIYAPPIRFYARFETGEHNNDRDDNNNTLADEMLLIRREYNADGSHQEVVLGRWITKGGLRCNRTGDVVLIEVVTIARDANGRAMWGCASTTVHLRNP